MIDLWGFCGGTLERDSAQLVENMVRPSGVEPPTFCSGGKRSIQLSYGRTEYPNCTEKWSLRVGFKTFQSMTEPGAESCARPRRSAPCPRSAQATWFP